MAHILIVEDDASLAQGIELALCAPERRFTACRSVREARRALDNAEPDLVIMDIGLPDGSGVSLCGEMRQRLNTPVLFLTANDTEICEVTALKAGGDDFLSKPFSLAVLRARVAALLRRSGRTAGRVYREGGLEFDFAAMTFCKDGEPLLLSRTEQRLLRLLVENRGQTLTREMLLSRVWDGGDFVEENALSVAIRRLRAKLEDDPKAPVRIETVYGLGYRWREVGKKEAEL